MKRREPTPRAANFYGMRSTPQHFNLGTWLEPEEITYPSGAMIRRARAINADTGRLKIVRCGIADTFFSIPVRGGGFLSMSTGGRILVFHPPRKYGTCEFCESKNVELVAALIADPDQRVCAACHADSRIPTKPLS